MFTRGYHRRGVVETPRSDTPRPSPDLIGACLAACRLVVQRWEYGDLGDAARVGALAIGQATGQEGEAA